MKLTNFLRKYPSKGKLHFLKIYENYFDKLKKKKINILEIGVDKGNSLKIWKDYFIKGTIVGIDLKRYDFKVKRIYTHTGSQSDEKFLKSIINIYKKFHIIIDDGSHFSKDIIFSFNYLFPHLVDKGFYIIEDLQTSYFPRYGGSRLNLNYKKSAINYFKRLVDSCNYESNDKPFFKRSFYDGKIKFVHFFQNVCIINKGNSTKLYYSRIISKSFFDILKKIISKFFN